MCFKHIMFQIVQKSNCCKFYWAASFIALGRQKKSPVPGKSQGFETRRFWKALFANLFLSTLKRKADVFKFLRLEERFRKAPFS